MCCLQKSQVSKEMLWMSTESQRVYCSTVLMKAVSSQVRDTETSGHFHSQKSGWQNKIAVFFPPIVILLTFHMATPDVSFKPVTSRPTWTARALQLLVPMSPAVRHYQWYQCNQAANGHQHTASGNWMLWHRPQPLKWPWKRHSLPQNIWKYLCSSIHCERLSEEWTILCGDRHFHESGGGGGVYITTSTFGKGCFF